MSNRTAGIAANARLLLLLIVIGLAVSVCANAATVTGTVRDESGAALPGVSVELRSGPTTVTAATDRVGAFRFDHVGAGRWRLAAGLVNFAAFMREIELTSSQTVHVDIVMHLALNAEVTVTGKRTFANLADVENPAENLVGIAQAASQGAITAKQLEERPLMRDGEVLETVPGVIVTQHSGEGKANQYFLRGFNLDHGTDFATTVGGVPVNMPSHAHGQGYTDLNFLIPELISGVQFSKGPYYVEQGDFATAGSANINYANALDEPIARVEAGGDGFGRLVVAASPKIGDGHLLAAVEAAHNDGPWSRPDDYQKLNGVLRYSRGTAVDGFSLTAMGYHGRWRSTDQIPQRAIASGALDRFGTLDPTDGGHTYRYSAAADWQRASADGGASTRIIGYGVAYDLGLFSNFTYNLNDPVHSDQIEQTDHRFVAGTTVSHRRLTKWQGRPMQHTVGIQLRNDDVPSIGLFHTQARVRLETRSQDAVVETMAGLYGENDTEWTPWLRTTAGFRVDAARFRVDALRRANSGTASAGRVSPKGGATLGPWSGTEFYVNAGSGFHSNDARGTTLTRDANGQPVEPVTPLVRAIGYEVGIRSVVLPHLQTTVSLWTLRLDSELVFSGDEGTTEPTRPSTRRGVEWANYFRPTRWLVFDADASWSRARFRTFDPGGQYVPEAVGTVLSAGAAVDTWRDVFGSVRLRYFGPRPLIEDDSAESKPTTLVNVQAGYRLSRRLKLTLDVFNALNASVTDIDYFYISRLPGEPLAGVADIHTHPALPRSGRLSVAIAF